MHTVQQYGMLKQKNVLLALSGGADSMSLLYLLHAMQSTFGFALEAAHVNHGLRGEESDRDEAFVRKVCGELSVPLHVLRTDVAAEAKKTGEGLEACGRRVRYAFFESVAKAEIATAHTLSDSCETVLQHLARGSGLRGLCGIAPVRGRIIRPLIACSRAEVEAFCRAEQIAYVTDSSNLSDDYSRNRIRRYVLPVLGEVYPGAQDAVGRCTELLRQDADYLDAAAQELLRTARRKFGYDASALKNAHPALRGRAIAEILCTAMHARPQLQHIRLCEALLEKGGAVQAEANATACVYGGLFYIRRPLRPAWTAQISDGFAALPFGRAKIEILSTEKLQTVHKDDLAKCVCCDTISSDVYFRSRQPGDAMTRVHSGCRKSVKKLLEEQQVPACFRNDIPVLTDGKQILWMEDVGCDADFALTPQSEKVMRIEVIRGENV